MPLTLSAGSSPDKYLLHMEAHSLYWTPSDGTTPRQTKLIVTVTTFDKKDKLLKSDAREVSLTAKPGGALTGPLSGPVVLACDVPSNPKAVRARFVVRVDRTGRMGTADADLLHPPQAMAAQGSTASAPTP